MWQIISWIDENKEWIFSGIGVTVFFGFVRRMLNGSVLKSDKEKTIKIEQKSEEKNSTQIGIQNNYFGGEKDEQ